MERSCGTAAVLPSVPPVEALALTSNVSHNEDFILALQVVVYLYHTDNCLVGQTALSQLASPVHRRNVVRQPARAFVNAQV